MNMFDDDRKDVVKYFGIVVAMMLFVILYVWQNIEVMKIKLAQQRIMHEEKQLICAQDKLRCQIEYYKTIPAVEVYALTHAMRRVSPDDIIMLRMQETASAAKKEGKKK